MAGITEELGLDIGPALGAVADLDRALSSSLTGAGEVLGTALAGAVSGFDPGPIAEAIREAVRDADATVTATLEPEGLQSEIERAVSEAEARVTITDVDAGSVSEAIDQAAADAQPTAVVSDVEAGAITEGMEAAAAAAELRAVVAEVDTAAVPESISAAVESADTRVTISDVDASAVSDAIEQAVGQADTSGISAVGQQASEASRGLGEMALQGLGAKTAIGGLEGATGLLGGSFGSLAGKAGLMGVGVGAVAKTVGVFFKEAEAAEAATFRLNREFGDLAGQVQNIDLLGLNTSLGDLAIKVGASDEGLIDAASNLAVLGRTSGAARTDVAAMAKEMIALSALLSVTNPKLGTADQIMQRLPLAFARGGRATRQFGVDMSTADFDAFAAGLGKTSAELTTFERIQATTQKALATFGPGLAKGIAEGSEQAGVQLRSLRVAVSETIERLGAPLVRPVVDTLKAVTPVLTSLASVIAGPLQAALPVVAALAKAFEFVAAPVLRAVAALAENRVVVTSLVALLGLRMIPTLLAAGVQLAFFSRGLLLAGAEKFGASLAFAAQGAQAVGTAAAGAATSVGALAAAGRLLGAVLPIAALVGFVELLRRAGNEGEEFASSVESSLGTISGTSFDDQIRATDAWGEALRDTVAQADSLGGTLQVATVGNIFEMRRLAKQLDAVGVATEQADKRALRFADNVQKIAIATGVSGTTIRALAKTLGVDLTQAGEAGEQGRQKLIDHLKEIAASAGLATPKLSDLLKAMSPEQVERFTKATADLATRLGPDVVARVVEAARGSIEVIEQVQALVASIPTAGASLVGFANDAARAVTAMADSITKTLPTVGKSLQEFNDQAKRGLSLDVSILTPGDLTRTLGEQTRAIEDFFAGTQALISRGATETAAALLELGPQAAGAVVHSLTHMSDQGLAAVEDATRARNAAIDRGNQSSTDQLNQLGKGVNLAELGKRLADETAVFTAFFEDIQTLHRKGFDNLASLILAESQKQGISTGAALAAAAARAGQEELTALDAQARDREAAIRRAAPVAAAAATEIGAAIRQAQIAALTLSPADIEAIVASGKPAGEAYVQGVAQGVSASRALLGDVGKIAARTVDSGFREESRQDSPSKVARQRGIDWSRGLVLGLEDGRFEVALGARLLAAETEGAFAEAAGIRSPSLVARGLGSGWVQGLVDALRAGRKDVALAAAGLQQVVASELSAPTLTSPALVVVSDGAVVVNFTGPVTTEAVPAVQQAVEQALGSFQRQLAQTLRSR